MKRPLLLIALVLLLTVPLRASDDAYRERVSRDYAAYVERKYGVVDDEIENQRVADIVRRLLQAAEAGAYSWRVRILANPQPNAFALPNGFIYVNQGLLDLNMDKFSSGPLGKAPASVDRLPDALPARVSDDELAFVLGHEIAHVTQDHAMRMQTTERNLASILRRSGAVVGPWARVGAKVFDQLLSSGFSRQFETDADHVGLMYMSSAGYDPNAALCFFERLDRLAKHAPSMQLFRSHPRSADRVKNLKAWLGAMPQAATPPGSYNAPPTRGLPTVWFTLPPLAQGTGASGAVERAPPQLRTTAEEQPREDPRRTVPEQLAHRMVGLRHSCNVTVKPIAGADAPLDAERVRTLAQEGKADALVEIRVKRCDSRLMPWPGGAVAHLELELEATVLGGHDGAVLGRVPLAVQREGTLSAELTRQTLYEALLDDAAQQLEARLEQALKPILPAPPPKKEKPRANGASR